MCSSQDWLDEKGYFCDTWVPLQPSKLSFWAVFWARNGHVTHHLGFLKRSKMCLCLSGGRRLLQSQLGLGLHIGRPAARHKPLTCSRRLRAAILQQCKRSCNACPSMSSCPEAGQCRMLGVKATLCGRIDDPKSRGAKVKGGCPHLRGGLGDPKQCP